jgi:hypothetical protein
VFASAEALCERGIMPMHPFGDCARLPRSDDIDEDALDIHAERVRVAALGGSAELFMKHYVSYADNATVYLALRRANGYVLLATVADHSSQGNDVPKFERFVGDDVSVEVHTLQEWFESDEYPDLRRETVRCTLGTDGGIRCNGECPKLAVVEPVPDLDCAAIASFDWSQLSRGRERDLKEDWGDRWDESQLALARDLLGIEEAEEFQPPQHVRTIEVEKRWLTVLEAEPGRWALFHEQVPLVASEREIRVGPGPGGVFVSSESAGQRQIHRLHIATHELEPVLPGHCS